MIEKVTILQEDTTVLRNLILIVVALAVVWGGIVVYNYLFTSQETVDTRLANMTMKEIGLRKDLFDDHVVSFDPLEPGEFNLVVKGVGSGLDAGRIGYNALAVLDGQNIKLESPRNVFIIYGYQDGELIFTITYITNAPPEIVLHGPFEGEEYIPSFGKAINPEGSMIPSCATSV